MKHQRKLEHWMERELGRHLTHMILDDGEGNVMAFGKFMLAKNTQGVQVSTFSDSIGTFTNFATAISYCVADRFRQHDLARRIHQLDRQKRLVTDDLALRRAQAERSTDSRFRETVLTKIETKDRWRRSVTGELDKCLDRAKYLQLRGFTNETARTGRT